CDIDAVLEAASRRGIIVIEDAAHAPGASWQGRMCGTLGKVGCFSFFSNKNLPAGEGGMLVIAGDEVADRVRLLRSHGMTTLTWARWQGHADSYDVVARGHNYRFDEVRAAIGLVQLGRLQDANRARGDIVARYRSALHDVDGIAMPFEGHDPATSAHHLAVVVLPRPGLRADMREHLRGRGVQTSLHYPPIHRFSEYSREARGGLVETDDVADRLLTLPLLPHMTDDQVELVVDSVLECVASSSEDQARRQRAQRR